jgi:hypothetical protein
MKEKQSPKLLEGHSTADIEQQQREAVAHVIGRLSLSWAYVELTIDGTISVLHDYFGGTKLERYRPQVFSRKLGYLVTGAKTLPQMSFLEVDMPVVDRLSALSEIRNWVIHGHLAKIGPDGQLTFQRHAKGKGFPKLEERVFRFDDLNVAVQEIHIAGTQVRALMDHLLDYTEHWSISADA